MGSYEYPSTEEATDIGCSLPYGLYCALCLHLLLPVCDTPILAATDTIHDILHGFKSIDFRNLEPPFGFPAVITSLVTL